MTRANTFFIQAMIGLLLLIVIGGCSPGSTGSGSGPGGSITAQPNITPMVPNDDLPTGMAFSSSTIAGVWYEASTGLILNLQPNSVRLIAACVQFESTGVWLANPAFAVEVLGTYISRNPLGIQPELFNGRVVISKPSTDGLFVQFIDRNGATILRTDKLRQVAVEPAPPVCIN